MDNLNIDFKKLLPFVVDSFSKVYGKEYYDIIFKKINRAVIIPYYDIEGLQDYISYVERCKRREYAIKFLDKIGIDVEKYKKNNYTQELDKKIEEILEYYIGGSYLGFCEEADFWSPLQAFKSNNPENPKKLLSNKVKIINYFLNSEYENTTEEIFELSEENFDLFIETDEYNKIIKKIDKINIVYESLLSEYRKWEEKLLPYKKFIESENKRKDEILKRKKNLLFLDIYSKLPTSVINAISSGNLEEESNTILGIDDISSTSIIESFSSEKMNKLKSKDVSLFDKFLIIISQVNYLKNIGVDMTNKEMLKCDSEEDVDNYLTFLKQDNVKKYIPTDDLISYIPLARENMYEEALKGYCMTRKDFKDLATTFGDNKNNLEFIYNQIKRKRVCITGNGATTIDNEFVSIMFYTIRTNDAGSLLFNFMHECGHVIDQNPNGIAFELRDDFNTTNPYDNAYRKYEKFNEALNDIFTLEAVELLHRHRIYLIEPQELTSLDASNFNTALITKNLLQPLVSKFREQVIKAKVKADRNELIRYIGEDNFEELVDAVNKVDYLSRNGVVRKLNTSQDDSMVKEYYEQVERVKKIYINIDNYYNSNIDNLITQSFHKKM